MRLSVHKYHWLLVLALSSGLRADGPWLVDITTDSGLDFHHETGGDGHLYLPETMGAGGCVLDFDGDGAMDIYLVQSGNFPWNPEIGPGNRLFRNLGTGTFSDVTEKTGTGDRRYGQGAVCGDIDGDGDDDILVNNFGPNTYLRNRGDGTFEDVSGRSGLDDPNWSTSAALLDADSDGDLDVYVVNYLQYSLATHRECRQGQGDVVLYCHPDLYPAAPDHLFANQGDGTFRDDSLAANLVDKSGKGLGVVATDIDGDGLVDLYVANDSTPNFLYHNLGHGRFEETGLFAGVSFNEDGRTEAGMGVDAGDIDGDQRFDLFVTNLSLESNTLYLQGAPNFFTDATRPSGLQNLSLPVLGFGTDLLDIDNDGDLDIVVANGDLHSNVQLFNDGLSWKQPGQIFLNDGRGRFSELPGADVGDFATPRVGRGTLTVDLDQDGRLDLVVSYNQDRARAFHNEGPDGAWIGFRLTDRAPNHSAIGARITAVAAGRSQTASVMAGSGYASSSDPRVHFGLGPASDSVDVEVTWPDGTAQRWKSLGSRAYYILRRGEAPNRGSEPSRLDPGQCAGE
ncbi:MAG: CRTAC1 family protein [Thermoanaerobaculia bacterium]|nr:CRTAC1 family protein [Thermoanaerobaculia bacterium]